MFYVFLVMDTRLYTLLCWSVGRSIRNIFEFRAVFALLFQAGLSDCIGYYVGERPWNCRFYPIWALHIVK